MVKNISSTIVCLLVFFLHHCWSYSLYDSIDISPESKQRITAIGKNCSTNETNFGWQCSRSNMCVPWHSVCDGESNCPQENSDETEGCDLFPETTCKSWNARQFRKCPPHTNPSRCVVDHLECYDMLQVPKTMGEGKADCPRETHWRCYDGFCITKSQVCDRHKDCEDGSDENEGCNLFPDSGCKSWGAEEHVKYSHPLKLPNEVCTLPKFSNPQDFDKCDNENETRCDDGLCIAKTKVQDGILDCMDGSDEKLSPLRWWMIVISIVLSTGIAFIIAPSFLKSRGKDLEDTPAEGRSQKYNAVLDLINVFKTDSEWANSESFKGKDIFAKIHQNADLLRYLYAHLVNCYGHTTDFLTKVINKLLAWEKDFHLGNERIEVIKCWRLHLGCTRIFKSVLQAEKNALNANVLWSQPLLVRLYCWFNALMLYFDICKDVLYAYFIYGALDDMTKGNIWDTKYDFETTLSVLFIASIVVVQVTNLLFTSRYMLPILLHHSSLKLLAIACTCVPPLMPGYNLVMSTYCHEQLLKLQKQEPECKASMHRKHRKIEEMSHTAALHQRFFYFYRVIQAFGSFVAVNILILMLLGSSRPSRDINLMRGFEVRMAQFLGVTIDDVATSNVPNVALKLSIAYSLFMIVSALAGYVSQCKDESMVFKGQLVHALYILCNLASKLYLTVMLFSADGPELSMLSGTVICIGLNIVQLLVILGYNFTIPEFCSASLHEQLIHSVVNLFVVIPFKSWDRATSEETKDQVFAAQDDIEMVDYSQERRSSAETFPFLLNSPVGTLTRVAEMNREEANNFEIIQAEWWKKPQSNLSYECVKDQLAGSLDDNENSRFVRKMEKKGYINKKLFLPRKTTRDYAFLLAMQILAHVIAFIIEVVNEQGYQSIAVRSLCFAFGFGCLWYYYVHYHVSADLCGVEPITAIPVAQELESCQDPDYRRTPLLRHRSLVIVDIDPLQAVQETFDDNVNENSQIDESNCRSSLESSSPMYSAIVELHVNADENMNPSAKVMSEENSNDDDKVDTSSTAPTAWQIWKDRDRHLKKPLLLTSAP